MRAASARRRRRRQRCAAPVAPFLALLAVLCCYRSGRFRAAPPPLAHDDASVTVFASASASSTASAAASSSPLVVSTTRATPATNRKNSRRRSRPWGISPNGSAVADALSLLRGGANSVDDGDDVGDVNDDEERYSRQYYALGARAHALVRTATVLIDGPFGDVDDDDDDGDEGKEGLGGNGGDKGAAPPPSGLVYETAKNLALSGVGSIVLVDEDTASSSVQDESEEGDESSTRQKRCRHHMSYHDGTLDDLGTSYRRAVLTEMKEGGGSIHNGNGKKGSNGAKLLAEYIRRLNPAVKVAIVRRSEVLRLLLNGDDDDDDDDEEEEASSSLLGPNPTFMCIDRPLATQLMLNDACRRRPTKGGSSGNHGDDVVPFVSVETAGVYGKIFCDFGPSFDVVDPDGETPQRTLLDRIELIEDDKRRKGDNSKAAAEEEFVVHCVSGERHEVSKGDIVEFLGMGSGGSGSGSNDHRGRQQQRRRLCAKVVQIQSPTRFTARRCPDPDGDDGDDDDSGSSHASSLLDFLTSVNESSSSFSRIKMPTRKSFVSLREARSSMRLRRHHEQQLFAPSDLDKSFDLVRRSAVMSSFDALNDFAKKRRRLPSVGGDNDDDDDVRKFRVLARKAAAVSKAIDDDDNDEEEDPTGSDEWKRIVTEFAQTCRGKFVPVQAFCGAVAAQEILKAVSGLYHPVQQFMLYDCDELLHVEEGEGRGRDDDTDADGGNDRGIGAAAKTAAAPGLSYVLGPSVASKLASRSLFVVGSGAIGCELLKNLAAMGTGTGPGRRRTDDARRRGGGKKKKKRKGSIGGRIVLTDMDTIERSNLSRQLLFRDHDVGKFKSAAAREAVLRFQPRIRIEAHTSKVGDDGAADAGPFDDEFWGSGVDVVLNALDNVEARLFMDARCVEHRLGLVDAGTLGPKGNTQVVVPFQSESYGSSVDPPEPSIPVCTLKNFPYDISHTIQWARDLFDGLYNRRPAQANDNVDALVDLGPAGLARSLIQKLGTDSALEAAEELGEDLSGIPDVDSTSPEFVVELRERSIEWAFRQAHSLFCASVQGLIRQHPVDSLDEDGEPFWSGTRRVPRVLTYESSACNDDEDVLQQETINGHIVEFIRSAARLRIESYLPSSHLEESGRSLSLVSREEVVSMLAQKDSTPVEERSPPDSDLLSAIGAKLDGIKIGKGGSCKHLAVVEFEKDDDSNGHVAFVTAASNLRALSYGIPPVDAMETRRVAGRIVPAMITTTALVSAISCIELLKLLQEAPLKCHRNAFVNFALPFFAFTAPLPAETFPGLNGQTYSLWDRISIKDSNQSLLNEGMTLREFLHSLKKKAGGNAVEVSSISYGPYLIYANFLHDGADAVLDKSLRFLVKEAVVSGEEDDILLQEGASEPIENRKLSREQLGEVSALDRKTFLDFTVVMEDHSTGEEVELPTVRVMTKKKT